MLAATLLELATKIIKEDSDTSARPTLLAKVTAQVK